MKVALYHPWIHLKGGGERVILEILKRGRLKYILFTNYFDEKSTFDEFKKFKVNVLTENAKMHGVLKRGLLFGLKYILPSKIPDLDRYDAFLVSTGGIAELITLRNNDAPTFCYCHTPLRAAHDWEYIKNYMIHEKSLSYRLVFKLSKEIYKIIEKPAWKRFIKIFANSNNTKYRLIRGKLAEEERIEVINPGVDVKKFKPRSEFDKIFFVPGRINKYKRQELAIRAFRKIAKKHPDFKLVVAGFVAEKDKWYYEKLLKLSKGFKNIIVLKNPDDKTYMDLFHRCYAVLFTAVNEDWGLIPIEANAAGKLVISVNEGGPRESLIDGVTGFLVSANPNSFAKIMEFLIKNEKLVRESEAACRKNALKYSWDNFVKKLENSMLYYLKAI